MGSPSIDIQGDLLWRTAGRHWGFTFITRPTVPALDGWYDFWEQVFHSCTPASDEVYLTGSLLDEVDHPHPFVASCFLDPVRRDSKDRPIPNYLVWFPRAPGGETPVSEGWGAAVVASAGPAVLLASDLAAVDGTPDDWQVEEAFRAGLAPDRRVVSLSERTVGTDRVQNLGAIKVKKKFKQTPPRPDNSSQASRQFPWWILYLGGVLFLLAMLALMLARR